MSPLIIFNISFAMVFYATFVIHYYRREPSVIDLILFVMNTTVALYSILKHFGLF
ncbi:hypothetical protein [Streptococcus gallolyticus]|uniref:hypothetical protein n=1 Tax=Streptococcus gallolyticus TaxID=315405 RepID=UPI000A55A162|nr:hypothetical protein [Streptococcus gallolyticus]